MSRRMPAPGPLVRLVLVAAVALSTFGRVASAQDAAAQGPATSAPTTAPEPIVDNPHYQAWSKFKPGSEVELTMNITAGGQPVTSDVTMRLIEMTPAKAVVESVATMHIPGVPNAEEHKQKHTFAARVPQSEADQAYLPANAKGESKDAGEEQVEAAGKTWICKVREFDGKVAGGSAKGKQWRNDDVPGGLVKLETEQGAVMKMNMVLKKVTIK